MLAALSEQGVDKVVLTSHFYAEDETPQQYVSKRDAAYKKLCEALAGYDYVPRLYKAAEVCYYIGISHMENPRLLCIEGTPLFMLEMPKCRWDRSVIAEAISLAQRGDIIVVLAHIDRYFGENDLSVFEELAHEGILMQANASFMADPANKRLIKKLTKKELVHFIGTDCHNMTSRPPQYAPAITNMRKYGGMDLLGMLGYFEERFF